MPTVKKNMILAFFIVISSVVSLALEQDFYSLNVIDSSGHHIPLSDYKGKVLLIVNVASHCGFTDGHYRDLVRLQRILSDDIFQVLAFPCNQFGNQEPGDVTSIVRFASTAYGANFPIFSKVNVIGQDVEPLWQFLQAKTGRSPDWNFWKYLIDHEGNVVGSWGPQTSVSELFPQVHQAVDFARRNRASRDGSHKDRDL